MAIAALKQEPRKDSNPFARDQQLEENGVVRSTVFPNRLRDVRREKGYESLTEFDRSVPDITYSRLAKIERGQIFPRPEELVSIADALGVEAGELLIDFTDPDFDPEAWARDQVEASLSYRGGALADMRIGAALRLRRHELDRSTTDMKDFGLPAATVSRIENADRPFSRWGEDIVQGVRRVFGVTSPAGMTRKINAYEKDGSLHEMMYELFSVESLRARQVGPFAQIAAVIPGERGRQIAKSIEMAAISGANDLADVDEAMSRLATTPVYEGVSLSDGSMVLHSTEDTVRRKAGTKAIAVRADRQILGPIDKSSVMVFEPIERDEVKENMVVAVMDGKSVMIGAIHRMGRGFRLVQTDPDLSVCLSSLEGDLARMVQVTVSD